MAPRFVNTQDYDWLEGLEEQTLLAAACKPLVPLLNFFMPSQKLKSKTRIGSKKIAETLFPNVYGEPKIPFQRLTENVGLPQKYKDMLKAQCSLYNTVELHWNVKKAIPRLRQRLAQSNRIKMREQLSGTFSQSQGAALRRHP
jgi:hypothetical protein